MPLMPVSLVEESGSSSPLIWTPVTYVAGADAWSDYGAPYDGVEYAKDANFVYFRGMANPDIDELEPFDPLPADYRPAAQQWLVGHSATGNMIADVQTDGRILFFGGVSEISCYFGNAKFPLT